MSYQYETEWATRQRTSIASFQTDELLQPDDQVWINGGVHRIELVSWDRSGPRTVVFAKPGRFVTAYNAEFAAPEPS